MTAVRDIMTPVPTVLRSTDTVQKAASLMATNGIGAIPVCGTGGQLRSMITDRDIVVRLVAVANNPAAFTLAEITEPTEVVTVDADTPIELLIETMTEDQVRGLPVTDNDQIIGIVSQGDI